VNSPYALARTSRRGRVTPYSNWILISLLSSNHPMVFGTSSVAVDLTIFRFVTYWFVRRPDVAKILLQEGIRGLKGLFSVLAIWPVPSRGNSPSRRVKTLDRLSNKQLR